MKLVRYGEPGAERPGLIDPAGVLRDLSDHATDIDANMLGDEALARLRRSQLFRSRSRDRRGHSRASDFVL